MLFDREKFIEWQTKKLFYIKSKKSVRKLTRLKLSQVLFWTPILTSNIEKILVTGWLKGYELVAMNSKEQWKLKKLKK